MLLGVQGSGLIDVADPLALVVMMVAWSTPTGVCAVCTGVASRPCACAIL